MHEACAPRSDSARKFFGGEFHELPGASMALQSWLAMIERCYSVSSTAFKGYGARGIFVCERWHNFKNFLADMGQRPDGLTLDRKDNDREYAPWNCHWANPVQQARNTRRSKILRIEGFPILQTVAARAYGIPESTLCRRIQRGIPADLAVNSALVKKNKLCAEEARSIKARLATGESTKAIAAAFGVTSQAISMIRLGKTWARV